MNRVKFIEKFIVTSNKFNTFEWKQCWKSTKKCADSFECVTPKFMRKIKTNRFRRHTTISRFSAIPDTISLDLKLMYVHDVQAMCRFHHAPMLKCSMRSQNVCGNTPTFYTIANESMTAKNSEKVAKTNQTVWSDISNVTHTHRHRHRRKETKKKTRHKIICSSTSRPMILMRCNLSFE